VELSRRKPKVEENVQDRDRAEERAETPELRPIAGQKWLEPSG
jgi:hypothetical protein